MCAQVCASRGYRFSNKHLNLYAPPRTWSDTSTHAPHQTSMGRKQPAREALSFRDARVYSGLSEREPTTISSRSLFARAPVSSRKAPPQRSSYYCGDTERPRAGCLCALAALSSTASGSCSTALAAALPCYFTLNNPNTEVV